MLYSIFAVSMHQLNLLKVFFIQMFKRLYPSEKND